VASASQAAVGERKREVTRHASARLLFNNNAPASAPVIIASTAAILRIGRAARAPRELRQRVSGQPGQPDP